MIHTHTPSRRVTPETPRRCDILKAARIRRGITRRELDREREAVRRFILDGHVADGFTSGQLLDITRQISTISGHTST